MGKWNIYGLVSEPQITLSTGRGTTIDGRHDFLGVEGFGGGKGEEDKS